MDSVALLYTTCPDSQTAETIGAALVAGKLAACVNILAPMTSIYEWEGRTEQAQEIPMLVKTTAKLANAVTEAIVAAHPYDCPCVLQLPISGGHTPFLEWITSQTTSKTHQ